MFTIKKTVLPLIAILITSGCAFTGKNIDVKPSNEPAYNFSQGTDLLSCVGRMIDATPNSEPIDAFVSNIPDHTTPVMDQGFLTKNSLMMATTALSRINSPKVSIIGTGGGLKGRHQIQMLGAFTELNRSVQSSALSGDSALPGGIRFSVGNDKQFTHIALDLALAENNRIVANTPTSVSIQVKGRTGDVKISYDEGEEWAASGGIGYKGQEGIHAAQRLLIETSVAIMISKYYGLDIINCLTENKKRRGKHAGHSYDQPIFDKATKNKEQRTSKPKTITIIKPDSGLTIIKDDELPQYIRELRTQTKAQSYNPSTRFASPVSGNKSDGGFTALNEKMSIMSQKDIKDRQNRKKRIKQPLRIINNRFDKIDTKLK